MTITARPLISAKYALDSDNVEYTAPANTRAIIDKFTATNTDSGAVTISVYIIPSGSVLDTSNIIIKTLSVSAGATDDITELKNHSLNAGDAISVIASVASKMVIRASGREVAS